MLHANARDAPTQDPMMPTELRVTDIRCLTTRLSLGHAGLLRWERLAVLLQWERPAVLNPIPQKSSGKHDC